MISLRDNDKRRYNIEINRLKQLALYTIAHICGLQLLMSEHYSKRLPASVSRCYIIKQNIIYLLN